METIKQAPWVEYLEIDEATRDRVLRDDTPDNIRKEYEKYIANREARANVMLPK